MILSKKELMDGYFGNFLPNLAKTCVRDSAEALFMLFCISNRSIFEKTEFDLVYDEETEKMLPLLHILGDGREGLVLERKIYFLYDIELKKFIFTEKIENYKLTELKIAYDT